MDTTGLRLRRARFLKCRRRSWTLPRLGSLILRSWFKRRTTWPTSVALTSRVLQQLSLTWFALPTSTAAQAVSAFNGRARPSLFRMLHLAQAILRADRRSLLACPIHPQSFSARCLARFEARYFVGADGFLSQLPR